MADLRELVKEIEKKRARGEVTDVDESTFKTMAETAGLGDDDRPIRRLRDRNAPRPTLDERMKEAFGDTTGYKKGGRAKGKSGMKKSSNW